MNTINRRFSPWMMLIGIMLMWGTAAAAPIFPADLAIDFRSADWAGANFKNSETVGNVTVWANSNYLMYQDGIDGLGIRNEEVDEINKGEILTIAINGGMYLSGVWITDLFDWDTEHSGENFGQPEYGHMVINNDAIIDFTAHDGQYIKESNGQLLVSFGRLINVSTVSFLAGSSWEYSNGTDTVNLKNEYSVAGLSAAPVPEPATMLLLGSGIVGIFGFTRKRRK